MVTLKVTCEEFKKKRTLKIEDFLPLTPSAVDAQVTYLTKGHPKFFVQTQSRD